MKVLIFATGDFYTKPNPSFHLLTALIDDMIEKGMQIHLVGMSEEGLSKHIPDNLENNPNFIYSLVPVKPVKKSSFVKRYLSGIKYALDADKYLAKYVPESDVIFVRSSPTVLYNLLAVRKYTKKHNVVYGIQDMFPGSTIASGKMPNKLMQKFFYRLQKIAYKKADIITTISEDMKTKVLQQGVAEEKVKVILNWFDDKSVREIDRKDNLFIQKYNMTEDKFYVQYAGTMGFVFDYKIVLDVAEILKPYDDIIIQMIGAGSQKEDFIREAEERKLTNIVFLPLEPQNMVPHVYSACDVCFIPLKKGIIGNSVPSKAGLLMACNRAIVTSADIESDYCTVINDKLTGIACDAGDGKAAAEAILRFKNDRNYLKACAERGHEYGKTLYSRTKSTGEFIEIFENLGALK